MKDLSKTTLIWSIFALVKILYMFLALFFLGGVTTLGDTARYLEGPTFDSGPWYLSSTDMMDNLAYFLVIIFGPILANLPFVFLSLFGIYYSVKRLNLNGRELKFLLVILSLPNFGIWTSVASKEAVSVFFLGIILGFLIDLIKKDVSNYFLALLAFCLCAFFKPQYLIGILSVVVFTLIVKFFGLKGGATLSLILLLFISSFIGMYCYRNEINELSFSIPAHFSLDAASTRPNDIWVYDFDVFWNAPYGMYVAFVGPTFSEALSSPIHLGAYLESVFVLMVFLVALFKMMVFAIEIGKFNIYYFGCFVLVSFWILFVHYPFGVLNPGSAVRYRAGFFPFLAILFYFLYMRAKFSRGNFMKFSRGGV